MIVRVNVVLTVTDVSTTCAVVIFTFDSEDGYRTGYRNVSHCQDYVHPDDQTQPTFEMTPGTVQTFHNLESSVSQNIANAKVCQYTL